MAYWPMQCIASANLCGTFLCKYVYRQMCHTNTECIQELIGSKTTFCLSFTYPPTTMMQLIS
ncbi:unnamed protein product [Albugo candida]|uniref:Uncharacterized protein n=1 Tax=Albugo candida TaxID=65357 RepID=A0A024GUP1_9STRA|nr:unnamed protein product [Albugo candida]|eukprot:CCI50697.1 unnamed protein product [Albugo candida]